MSKKTESKGKADSTPPAHAVHADPEVIASIEKTPLPPGVARKPYAEKSAAQWAYERVILYIKNFEEQLKGDEEVAIGFTTGGSGVLRIEGVGYFDPDIVTFYGSDEAGLRTQLVQHVSQLNVMLRAVPTQTDAPEARRVGFRLAAEFDADE